MIRQPNVILGNDGLLVTMGRKGDILGLFYPRRDHAQHVEESLRPRPHRGKTSLDK